MFKLIVVFAISLAVASAGLIGHDAVPYVAVGHHGHASSHANGNLLAVHPVPVSVPVDHVGVGHLGLGHVGLGHAGFGHVGLGHVGVGHLGYGHGLPALGFAHGGYHH